MLKKNVEKKVFVHLFVLKNELSIKKQNEYKLIFI